MIFKISWKRIRYDIYKKEDFEAHELKYGKYSEVENVKLNNSRDNNNASL